MRKLFAVLILMTALPAYAQGVTQVELDADYKSCMGGESQAQDPQRAQYCTCIKNGVSGWSAEQYNAVSSEVQATGQKAPPAALTTLAQSCIAQVLHK